MVVTVTSSRIEAQIAVIDAANRAADTFYPTIELVPNWQEKWRNSSARPSQAPFDVLLEGSIVVETCWDIIRNKGACFRSVFQKVSEDAVNAWYNRPYTNMMIPYPGLKHHTIEDMSFAALASECQKHGMRLYKVCDGASTADALLELTPTILDGVQLKTTLVYHHGQYFHCRFYVNREEVLKLYKKEITIGITVRQSSDADYDHMVAVQDLGIIPPVVLAQDFVFLDGSQRDHGKEYSFSGTVSARQAKYGENMLRLCDVDSEQGRLRVNNWFTRVKAAAMEKVNYDGLLEFYETDGQFNEFFYEEGFQNFILMNIMEGIAVLEGACFMYRAVDAVLTFELSGKKMTVQHKTVTWYGKKRACKIDYDKSTSDYSSVHVFMLWNSEDEEVTIVDPSKNNLLE